MMLNTLSPRAVFCGLVLLAIAAMLFARVYLQGYLGLEACPLCMTQRVFVVLWGMIALVAALHNPAQSGPPCIRSPVRSGGDSRRRGSGSPRLAATPAGGPGTRMRPKPRVYAGEFSFCGNTAPGDDG